ncbi:hypothetical protein RAE03_12205 [Corynebacterium tuberculostearicum]|uniref:Uncharacterized protein n=1 Tax=Corynebacterium tuberculostearicum TaxID=38304 RepID=A0AAE4SZV8_9CORY|nr:hypothetical protein [Corynebacterium tuberculostearicum]MDV2420515.1 hypothetical protein [Corynebacterium tuberculostearicum]MDV2433213.1 hypothetical protein [Corynebacterium tuberculostearicum]
MSVYLRRDIDYLLAPYSYDQLFLKLPFDYAVEAAAQSRVFLTHQDAANSYWSQQYVNIDTTVDDLPHALRLGVHDPQFPRRWAAVLETTNPDWVWFISDDPLEYPRFLEFIGTAGSIPYVPSMTEVLIVDEPDERKIVEGWNVGSGSKNVTVCSYDIRAAVGASTPTAEIRNYDYFSVGIGEGETRFQAFTDWPDGEEFAFPGLERLKTKKGPLRKRFTTEDLFECAQLFGLDPFNRQFLTGRATLINSGYPLPKKYGPCTLFERREHTWDREHEGN